jgi:hypothetical protein
MYRDEIVEIKELFLNEKNYRIDYERYNTLEKVVERLYLDENIIGMIKGIVEYQGIYPHERLIVIPKDSSGFTVVEGNRRVLAIKSLLGMINPPAKYKREVSSLAEQLTNEAKESIKHIGVVIFEVDDKRYFKIIADKHSTVNYERWGQISQWHFFKDLYNSNNKDLDLTANDLGKNRSDVANYIRFYNLISYIRSLPYWDENDLRDKIESNVLEATRLTRPLSIEVKNALNLNWQDNLELKIPNEDLDEYNEVLCKYTAAALVSGNSEYTAIYTRSNNEEVKNLIDGWKEDFRSRKKQENEKETGKDKEEQDGKQKGRDDNKKNTNESGNNKSSRAKKPVIYFSDLKCTVDQNRLKRLTHELSKITMSQFPAAAIMLTRSLLESALIYQIEKQDLKQDYFRYNGRDGLKKILNFSIREKNRLFSDPKSAKGLEYLQSSRYKDFMDDIVHSKWIDPRADDVANIAGKIKELLKVILTDSA